VGSGDGTEGSTGAGSTGMTNPSDTGMTAPTTQASQSGDSGSSGGESSDGADSSSGGPVPVLLSGEVQDLVFSATIPDAEISVLDQPGFETTSDMDGLWGIGPIDPNQDIVFQVAPSMDFVGALIPYAVEDEDDDNVRLAQISRSFLSDQEMLLAAQMPAAVDPDGAILIVRLASPTALMDGDVTVDMTPAPVAGTYYAPDVSGAPILDSNVISFSLVPVVVFFNLPETGPGDITFAFTHPTDTCVTAFTNLPTMSDHITLVDVTCS
jgi:hypothetical protein